MSFKYKALIIITPLVFIADQLTKWLVVKYIPFGDSVPVISGYFDLVYLKNPGAAFGMLSSLADGYRQVFFYVVAAVAVIVLAAFYRSIKESERLLPIGIALVFGGIAGNIMDRIISGEVTDFLSVHIKDAAIDWTILGHNLHIPLIWPAFNVADSAITVAMVLLVITAFRAKKGEI